ncbi:GNAT family N-acetyltransferase [Calidifontibacter terrae]
MSQPIVTNNPQQSRYEAHVDDAFAGRAEYELGDGLITFTHTIVEPQFEGRGVASALVRTALDDVRSDGSRQVLPECPYVKAWIEKHPDYLDLVYGAPTHLSD